MMSELAHFHFGFYHHVQGASPFHTHEHTEIVYHEGGNGRVEMADGKIFHFTRNSVILHQPGMTNGQINRTPTIDYCLDIEYPREWNGSLFIPRLTDLRLRQELTSLAKIKTIPDSCSQKICDLRATTLLLELLPLATTSATPEPQEITLDSQLANVYSYFQNQFDIIGNLDEVAVMHGLSVDYFRHQFTRKYGISPKKYLLSLRLEHAKKLLRFSPLPQKTIAKQCGFDNIRYFNTRFHHYCGMTPGEYRDSRRLDH